VLNVPYTVALARKLEQLAMVARDQIRIDPLDRHPRRRCFNQQPQRLSRPTA